MNLVTELIEFALKHHLLSAENKRQLEKEGFYTFGPSSRSLGMLLCFDPIQWEEIDCLRQFEFDMENLIDEEVAQIQVIPQSLASIFWPSLNNKRITDWQRITQPRKRTRAKVDRTMKKIPWYRILWNSRKVGRFQKVLDDGFTFNQVYSLLNVELRDYLIYSGHSPPACCQFLRQRKTAAETGIHVC